jgi:hypothetical protein
MKKDTSLIHALYKSVNKFQRATLSAQALPSLLMACREMVIALRPQTPKHIRGGWSHYTNTSEPLDGNGAQNYGHCPVRVRTSDFLITGPRAYQLL